MSTLNLGILAHIDAGKTSLSERLLFAAGAIGDIGSVDEGSTRTDSMALERRRGITIKSAVVSFAVDDVVVNLIDTPGHPDFIAEVERVLGVLDGAVVVVSAVEGVQAQTRVLMRTLQRLGVPTLIFVNKVDRRGARYDDVLRMIAEKLSPTVFAMGNVSGLGTPGAEFVPHRTDDATVTARLTELLMEHDDSLLTSYVNDESAVAGPRLWDEFAVQARRAQVHPVFFGSAITGAGVAELLVGIRSLLPTSEAETNGPVSGTVFKIERDRTGEKLAYVRMFSGTVRIRDRLSYGSKREGKVTEISVFDNGTAGRQPSLTAGHIGRIRGLVKAQIGDSIGEPGAVDGGHRFFAPPTLETVVVPSDVADRGMLYLALTQLAEQDPLINLRRDESRDEMSLSLYGEVQKEVIQETLAEEFGVEVTFRKSTTICIERVTGTGEAVERIGKEPNPFLATVGLRVSPAPVGTGIDFRVEVELGALPSAFLKAVEESVRQTLSQGLYGWQVADCSVTLTQSGYWARQSHAGASFDKSMSSTAGDFRGLTPLVLMTALKRAGTEVHEPMHHFRLDIPAELLGALLPVLGRLRAAPRTPRIERSSCMLEGTIPAAMVHELEQRLPTLTSGEGLLETSFCHYEQVTGSVPTRLRSDHNPLDRKEYLLHVMRRI